MKKLSIFLALLGSLLGLLGTSFGVVWFTDGRYAMASDQQELTNEVKILKLKMDLENAMSDRSYYRKKARQYPKDKDFRERLRQANEDVTHFKKLLRELDKPMKKEKPLKASDLVR